MANLEGLSLKKTKVQQPSNKQNHVELVIDEYLSIKAVAEFLFLHSFNGLKNKKEVQQQVEQLHFLMDPCFQTAIEIHQKSNVLLVDFRKDIKLRAKTEYLPQF